MPTSTYLYNITSVCTGFRCRVYPLLLVRVPRLLLIVTDLMAERIRSRSYMCTYIHIIHSGIYITQYICIMFCVVEDSARAKVVAVIVLNEFINHTAAVLSDSGLPRVYNSTTIYSKRSSPLLYVYTSNTTRVYL